MAWDGWVEEKGTWSLPFQLFQLDPFVKLFLKCIAHRAPCSFQVQHISWKGVWDDNTLIWTSWFILPIVFQWCKGQRGAHMSDGFRLRARVYLKNTGYLRHTVQGVSLFVLRAVGTLSARCTGPPMDDKRSLIILKNALMKMRTQFHLFEVPLLWTECTNSCCSFPCSSDYSLNLIFSYPIDWHLYRALLFVVKRGRKVRKPPLLSHAQILCRGAPFSEICKRWCCTCLCSVAGHHKSPAGSSMLG